MKNKLRTRIVKFLAILLIFQLILSNGKTSFAALNTTVTYTVTGTPKVGNTIEIAVNVSNIKDLYGGSIDFLYDPKILQVQSITKGNILGKSEVLTPIGENSKISEGQASFALILKGNKPRVSNNGTISIIKAGSVKLNTTSSNTPALSLSGNTVRVKLSNPFANSITYTYENKTITTNTSSDTIKCYEENNSLIKYTGNWINSSSTSHSGGTAKYSNVKGNKITFSFEGTGFKWYGMANDKKGIANVYIDGIKQTVDTYSKSAIYKKLFFEKTL